MAGRNKAVEFINNHVRLDEDSISNAKTILEELRVSVSEKENKLSLVTTEAPNQIDNAVQEAERSAEFVKRSSVEKEQLCEDIANQIADTSTLVKDLTVLTDKVKELELYSSYLKMIGRIQDYSSDIQSALIIQSTERAVTSFAEFSDLVESIQETKCKHLLKFAEDTLTFWYNILRDKYSEDFEEVLKVYEWPFIVSTTKPKPQQANVEDIKKNFEPLFLNLLKLQLPEKLRQGGSQLHPFLVKLIGENSLPLPMELMLKPLRKRFRFHFYGKKQTNSIEKPEWYLTVVMTWIKEHQAFLTGRIQPLFDKAGWRSHDAVVMFSSGLVVLVMEKMLTDLPEVLYDDHNFSHLVDEALSFNKELRTSYGYPVSLPGPLHVLSRDEAFNKWIHIEKKFAFEKVDAMVSKDSAWLSQYKDVDEIDELRVPECAESFMTLMLTITERYQPLPHISHRLKFLDLQLELLDDFRIRLLQIKTGETADPLGTRFSAILNSVSYISEILKEWSELVFFLQLQHAKDKSPPDSTNVSMTDFNDTSIQNDSKLGEGSVFREMISLFEMMKLDMLNALLRYVVDDIKARSKPYRKDKWIDVPAPKNITSLGLSLSACEMFLVMKDHLIYVQDHLSTPLFNLFWRKAASDLNQFFYSDVILANHFDEGGAHQLNFDMTRNLFPFFGQFTKNPENFFKDVKEACLLLTMNVGSALLLKEMLYQTLHKTSSYDASPTDPIPVLQEMGIHKLDLDEVELVLSLRTDLSVS